MSGQPRNHGSIPGRNKRFSCLLIFLFRLPLGSTQSRVRWVIRDLYRALRGAGCEVEKLPVSCVEVNVWSCTSTPYTPS
jgi:hypothetical protein